MSLHLSKAILNLYLIISMEFFSHQMRGVNAVRVGDDDHNSMNSTEIIKETKNICKFKNGVIVKGAGVPWNFAAGDCLCPELSSEEKKDFDHRPMCGDLVLGTRKFFKSRVPFPLPNGCVPECRKLPIAEAPESKSCENVVAGATRTRGWSIINNCKCLPMDGFIAQVGTSETNIIAQSKFGFREAKNMRKKLGPDGDMQCVKTKIPATFVCRQLFRFFGFFERIKGMFGGAVDTVQRVGMTTKAVAMLTADIAVKSAVLSVGGVVLAFMGVVVNLLKVVYSVLCTGDACAGLTALILIGFGIFSIIMFFNPLGFVTGTLWVGLAITAAAYIIRRNGVAWCKAAQKTGSKVKDWAYKKSQPDGKLEWKDDLNDIDQDAWAQAQTDASEAMGMQESDMEAGGEFNEQDKADMKKGVTLDINKYKSGLPNDDDCQAKYGQACPAELIDYYKQNQEHEPESITNQVMPDEKETAALVSQCTTDPPGEDCQYASADIQEDQEA